MDKFRPNPYAGVICLGLVPGHGCGNVGLTYDEYMAQMIQADTTWRCPQCRAEATFDDDLYEQIHFPGEDEHAAC